MYFACSLIILNKQDEEMAESDAPSAPANGAPVQRSNGGGGGFRGRGGPGGRGGPPRGRGGFMRGR